MDLDHEEWREHFRRHYLPLVAYFRDKIPCETRCRLDAEDLAQVTLVLAFEKGFALQPASLMRAWLVGSARNVLRDHVKCARRALRRERSAGFERTERLEARTPHEPALELDLPCAVSVLAIEHYVGEIPLLALAEKHHVSLSTVSRRIHRALEDTRARWVAP